VSPLQFVVGHPDRVAFRNRHYFLPKDATPMAELTPLNVNGAVVFWSVKKTEHDLICAGLSELDLHDFAPDPRTTVPILKDALAETFSGGQYKIDTLDSKDGYSITQVTKGEGSTPPSFKPIGNVTVSEAGTITFFSDIITYDEETLIRERFEKFSGQITAGQVTNCLIKILTRFGGITLRPSGAVYWLPVEALPEWERVVDVIEKSAVEGQTSMVHVMKVTFDESSVRAVGEGLVDEVTTEADELITKITKENVKDATLKRTLARAEVLRLKVTQYEQALGKSLTGLHSKLEEITVAETQGNLMALADTAN